MNTNVNTYFTKGCGRCSLYDTPKCKVLKWKEELTLLRALLVGTILKEESKWGSPCYTYNDGNVLMIQSFKTYCALMFFKGSLLKDPKALLVKAGENAQGARQVRFTNAGQIKISITALKAIINDAIDVEKKGLRIQTIKEPIAIIPELKEAFRINPSLKKAFESLTPGRQRGYHIFFSQAKQTETRTSRIQKYTPHILAGKGMQD